MEKRHVIAFMAFLSYALVFSIKITLSIAIVAMVKGPILTKTDTLQTNDSCNHYSSGDNISAHNYATSNKSLEPITKYDEGEFSWTESEQGLILGSFFWGYIITQIPGGWLAHKFGGKWPLGIGLLIAALLSLLTPIATRAGGFSALVFIRATQGLALGVTMPSMFGLLARWFPPKERGHLAAFANAGLSFGTAVSLLVSGNLVNQFGWPSAFYVTGTTILIWFGFWVFLVHNDPKEHPNISDVELKYIQNSLSGDSKLKTIPKGQQPPWRKVFTSGPFCAILVCQFADAWSIYTMLTELPTYMKTVLHFDIEANTLLSALPYILSFIVAMSIPKLGDYFLKREYLSIGGARKTCNSIGMFGMASALILVAYSGCNRVLTVTLICFGVGLSGSSMGGVWSNLNDIAPNYAGILTGITNTVANISGIFAPYVAGIIIDNDPSISRWRIIFLITAAISFSGNLIFLLMASGREEAWSKGEKEEVKLEEGPTGRESQDASVQINGENE